MNRRRAAIIAMAAVAFGGGGWIADVQPWRGSGAAALVTPTDPAVTVAERARAVPGARVRAIRLVARPATVDLGARTVRTWTFNGTVPGPQITARAGDTVRAEVVNELPEPLTVHWHGITIRDNMDGVPDLTQPAIRPGAAFTYTFTVAEPGTYFYHSHVGVQLDRGLYGPLIVQPRQTAASSGVDLPVVLDDWVDGAGRSPDDVYRQLRRGSSMPQGSMSSMPGMDSSGDSTGDAGDMAGMPGMDMTTPSPTMGAPAPSGSAAMGSASPLGADTADLDYPYYLINGRTPGRARELSIAAGKPVRLRLINAASATPFRVAVAGRQLTVVATDGYPVTPVTVDTLIIGMGERYDVLVTAPRSGTAALVAIAEGRSGQALAVLRAGPGRDPAADTRPAELGGRLLTLDDLHATGDAALPTRSPDRTFQISLTGAMASYRWGINTGVGDGRSLPVHQGQRIRLVLTNRTMMWHPIHLHGHTFQVVTGTGTGARKDTVIVPAMGKVTVEFDAHNPGQWLLHCHNVYHAQAGMTATVRYVR